MAIEMRELQGDDLFLLLTIVGKLNIKDDLVEIFQNNMESELTSDHKKKAPTKAELAKKEIEARRRGMEGMATLIQRVLLNLPTVKHDVNSLLAAVTDLNEKEIGELGFKDYTDLVVRFFKKEELQDFLQSITSLA